MSAAPFTISPTGLIVPASMEAATVPSPRSPPPTEDQVFRGFQDWIQKATCCSVKRVLHKATVLHAGWELDNEAWIVELDDGSVSALTTNHGGPYWWSRAEMEKKLCETEASAVSLREAMAMLPEGDGETD